MILLTQMSGYSIHFFFLFFFIFYGYHRGRHEELSTRKSDIHGGCKAVNITFKGTEIDFGI